MTSQPGRHGTGAALRLPASRDAGCEEKFAAIKSVTNILPNPVGTRKECIAVIDEKMKEVRKESETVHSTFRDIIKQQEEERRQVERSEVVKMLKQNETVVREIAERKKCVIFWGLKEDANRNWQERKKNEEEKVQNLLNRISGEGNMSGEVEEIVRIGTYEEGKNRPLKMIMKSQVAAEALLRDSW